MKLITRQLRRRRIAISGALLAAALAAPRLFAADRHWNVPNGSWNHNANWSLGVVPGAGDTAFIAYNSVPGSTGIAQVGADVGSVTRVNVMRGNTIDIGYRGVLRTSEDLNLGVGDAGFLKLSTHIPTALNQPTLNIGRDLRVGVQDANGRVDQSAGYVNVAGNLSLGHSGIPTNPGFPGGIYNLAGGQLTVNGTVLVAGDSSGSTGEFQIHAPAVAHVGGMTGNHLGFVHHLGGEMRIGQGGLVFPVASGARFMRYTLHDGTFTSAKVVVNNAGELEYRGGFLSAGHLSVNGGRVVFAGDEPKMLHTIDVTVTDTQFSTGFIDLNDGGLTTESTGPASSEAVRVQIARGYRGGLWTSDGVYRGITSRAAGASASTSKKTALGYADSLDLGIAPPPGSVGSIAGGSSIIVRHTLYGDANLDGHVNLQDFNRLASNFGTVDKFWVQGDFNYDRIVNLQDFNLMAANFGLSAGPDGPTPDDWTALASAIPEANTAALFGAAAGFALLRRKCARGRQAGSGTRT